MFTRALHRLRPSALSPAWRDATAATASRARLAPATASFSSSAHAPSVPLREAHFRKEYDAIILGGGHNGLVSAAYLAKAGKHVLVLERRDKVGGAAITEEVVPGFKFSRASYLAGLLRPQIIEDLELHKLGLKYLPRNPSSFTPSPDAKGAFLMLGSSAAENFAQVSKFSRKDAEALPKYEAWLDSVVDIFDPLLDDAPPELSTPGVRRRLQALSLGAKVGRRATRMGMKQIAGLYEMMTAPAKVILDRWFESEMLKTTLATDAVIGAVTSPSTPGSAYVLLHHVMGEVIPGARGVWAYVEGGMGMISHTIGVAARRAGATVVTGAEVDKILLDGNKVRGVRIDGGREFFADVVMSNVSPHHTFLEQLADDQSKLPEDFKQHVKGIDYSCGAFKINLAVDGLPNFKCCPSPADGTPGPQHRGTIHFETQMSQIEAAYRDAIQGRPAERPVIELTIPSALDTTLAPEGKHVCQLFVQFAPYDLDPEVGSWSDPAFKDAFVDRVLNVVEEYAPGFKKSIIGIDALSPLDLETIFGLHKGNIFHGAMSPNQLMYTRPAPGYSAYRTPLKGLYMCGSGAHPGGGVMGAPGRNAAAAVLQDMRLF